VDSDHRALFIDVNIDIILGGRPPMFSSPALRGIDSTADDNCKTYISLLLKYLLDHNVFDRAERLKTWTTQHGLTERLTIFLQESLCQAQILDGTSSSDIQFLSVFEFVDSRGYLGTIFRAQDVA
jgi:hypothetical protein